MIAECKRLHGLGGCSRFGDQRCPEIHIEGRKRPYCQYWARGLRELVSFEKPTPSCTLPKCDSFYQLMRNHMIGDRRAKKLSLELHLMVVKGRTSPHIQETLDDVAEYNSLIPPGGSSLVCWNDLRFVAGHDLLSGYHAELSRAASDLKYGTTAP